MPGKPDVPDLDAFLSKKRTGQCAFCQNVPPELQAAIATRVAKGIRAWKAYAEWLQACGVQIKQHAVTYHFDALKLDPTHGHA